MGYKLLYWSALRRPERHYCCGRVSITPRTDGTVNTDDCYLLRSLPLPATFAHDSAFAVGLVSNLYSRIFSGNAFVVMVRHARTSGWSDWGDDRQLVRFVHSFWI